MLGPNLLQSCREHVFNLLEGRKPWNETASGFYHSQVSQKEAIRNYLSGFPSDEARQLLKSCHLPASYSPFAKDRFHEAFKGLSLAEQKSLLEEMKRL